MIAKRKPAAKGIYLKGEGATDEGRARAVARQKAWAYAVADGIERGELPATENERQMLAVLLRSVADQLSTQPVKGPGNPSFERKLPDDDSAVLAVRMRELRGESHAQALRQVAESFGMLDESQLAKRCRERQAAVDDFFRGEIVLGKGRRNSRE